MQKRAGYFLCTAMRPFALLEKTLLQRSPYDKKDSSKQQFFLYTNTQMHIDISAEENRTDRAIFAKR